MKAQPWLWPASLKDPSAWNVRFARVFHWAATAIGAASLLFGAYLSATSYQGAAESRKQIARWEKLDRLDIGAKLEAKFPWQDYSDIIDFNAMAPAEEKASPAHTPELRPFEQEGSLFPLFAGAFGLALSLGIGRAARYIIAGE